MVQVSSLKSKGLLRTDGTVAGTRAFAAYYAGDYDGAAWLYNQLLARWDDPKRGTVPIGWASKRLATTLLLLTSISVLYSLLPCLLQIRSQYRSWCACSLRGVAQLTQSFRCVSL
jgi:hypothetical protein